MTLRATRAIDLLSKAAAQAVIILAGWHFWPPQHPALCAAFLCGVSFLAGGLNHLRRARLDAR